VWQPVDEKITRCPGFVTWPLRVARAGPYYLWARVLAPSGESNSFYVALIGDTGDLLPKTTWDITPANQWRWQRVSLAKSKTPTPLSLPAGICHLQLQAREPGVKLDRLFLAADPGAQPPDHVTGRPGCGR
jgi:hypothetical protein